MRKASLVMALCMCACNSSPAPPQPSDEARAPLIVERYAGGKCSQITVPRKAGMAAIQLDDKCRGWRALACQDSIFIQHTDRRNDPGVVAAARAREGINVRAAVQTSLERDGVVDGPVSVEVTRIRCPGSGEMALTFESTRSDTADKGGDDRLDGTLTVLRDGQYSVQQTLTPSHGA